MAEKSSVFDMIGPVMIGPSSSHTAGVVRIGNVGYQLLQGRPEKADITFYNSFARTFEGHGSDRAILAGLMGFTPDDARIKDSLSLATQHGLDYSFRSVGNASTLHPNTVKVDMQIGDVNQQITGESRGGGVIRIKEVNGFHANIMASTYTLIVEADDVKGSIAFITDILSHDNCNIATMTVSRKAKHAEACLILEMDSGPAQITLDYIDHLSWVKRILYIPDV